MMLPANTALIILAAGSSQRFGQVDKLNADMHGQTLLAHSLAVYDTIPFAYKIAVTSPDSQIDDICRNAGFDIVVNKFARAGMGSSLATGVAALCANGVYEHACIGLGDMPFINPDTIRMMLKAVDTSHSIVVPQYNGQDGHPVIFSAMHFASLRKLNGDKGGRGIIAACPNTLHFAVNDAGINRDIDTPEALEEARKI